MIEKTIHQKISKKSLEGGKEHGYFIETGNKSE
jgi:hypothetical protein